MTKRTKLPMQQHFYCICLESDLFRTWNCPMHWHLFCSVWGHFSAHGVSPSILSFSPAGWWVTPSSTWSTTRLCLPRSPPTPGSAMTPLSGRWRPGLSLTRHYQHTSPLTFLKKTPYKMVRKVKWIPSLHRQCVFILISFKYSSDWSSLTLSW